MITDSNNRFNPGYTQGSWVASGLFAVAAHPHRIQARNTVREECSKAYLVPDSFSTKDSFPKQIRCTTTGRIQPPVDLLPERRARAGFRAQRRGPDSVLG